MQEPLVICVFATHELFIEEMLGLPCLSVFVGPTEWSDMADTINNNSEKLTLTKNLLNFALYFVMLFFITQL